MLEPSGNIGGLQASTEGRFWAATAPCTRGRRHPSMADPAIVCVGRPPDSPFSRPIVCYPLVLVVWVAFRVCSQCRGQATSRAQHGQFAMLSPTLAKHTTSRIQLRNSSHDTRRERPGPQRYGLPAARGRNLTLSAVGLAQRPPAKKGVYASRPQGGCPFSGDSRAADATSPPTKFSDDPKTWHMQDHSGTSPRVSGSADPALSRF